MDKKEIEILELLEKNGRMDVHMIARMVEMSAEEVESAISKFEEMQIVQGYSTLIDWTDVRGYEGVTAMIDVKVTPIRGKGFNDVAERIYRFPEVKAVYLMSGAYDLSVSVEGKTMSQVARFVSEKLSTLDTVISTTTHFILKKYKHDGIIFGEDDNNDRRMPVSP
ncbi:Lrp/AsnC family transcriptional regulator [Terribacillus sp. 179-K 1B1 HS]|uniref:Lrp/AsnC family transcriptional regulator n=1 Tax=Terribacillus sp. 179-K 1B1 HS TaxID=3142388 RepID=UPI0039A008B4